MSRTSCFESSPRGKSVRASCSCVRPKRKYDWSFVSSGFRIVADAGIVTGSDAVSADLSGRGEELIELHVIVAEGARNRSAAFEVVVDEGADDCVLEFALEINHVEWDAEVFGYTAGVVDVVD